MRVGLSTWGTEGDIRPFFAIASALAARGHEVEVVYCSVEGRSFEALARGCGFEARSVGSGYFQKNQEKIEALARENLRVTSPLKQLDAILRAMMDPIAGELFDATDEVARGCDAVVGHFLSFSAAIAAEKQGKKYAMVAFAPVFSSAHYPPIGAPDLGRWLNPMIWRLATSLVDRTNRGRVEAIRQRAGLGPGQGATGFELASLRLLAVSPALFERPGDWDEQTQVCGFARVDEGVERWEPPAGVRAFLDEGPPVFASFGSMFTVDRPGATLAARHIAEAASLAGVRMILQAPRAVLDAVPASDRLCTIEHAPHGPLFARCSLIVHHGGAGTTQSALLAGRPSVVVPHAADQFYWGDLLHRRGAASRPLARNRLAPGPLAERIKAALAAPAMAQRAAELGATLRHEGGAARAAELIERGLAG